MTTLARRAWVAVAAAGIAALTLTPQGGTSAGTSLPWACVLCGPESGADAVGNVWLFVPLGAALVGAGASARRAVLVGALGTLGIEAAQALGIPGREATLGDLLTNVAGATLGAALASRWDVLRRPSPPLAGRLAAIAGLLWVALMALSAWLVGRDGVPGPVPPRLGTLPFTPGYGWYQGRVVTLRVDGWVLDARRGTGPAIMRAPLGRVARFALEVVGGDSRAGPVPILFVHDAAERAQLVVAQRGPDAVLWVRLRAARWKLRRPQLVLPGAFATLRGQSPRRRARLAGGVDGPTLWLAGQSSSGQSPAGTDPGPPGRPAIAALRMDAARGWALVLPFARPYGPERYVLDVLWVGALLVPLGYWLRRAIEGTARPGGRALAGAATATTVVAGFVAVPVILGGAVVASPAAWLAAIAAAAGWQAGGRTGR